MVYLLAILLWLLVTAATGTQAQVVVSSDGEFLFLTRIGEGTEQIDVGGGVVAVAANAKHAYGLASGGKEVAQVRLADGEIEGRMAVPCCGAALAVTEDDSLLAVGASAGEGVGQLHLFDLGTGHLERSVDLRGSPERALAEGCEFVVISPDPRPRDFFFSTHPTHFFFNIVTEGGNRVERHIAGFFKAYVASAKLVLSLDMFERDIVLTRLSEAESQRIRFVNGPSLAVFTGPRDATATSGHAYVITAAPPKVGRVELASGELTTVTEGGFPCCGYVLGLSSDGRLLLVGFSDLGRGAVWAYVLDAGEVIWGVAFEGDPQYLFVDEERLVVLSRYIDERSSYSNFFITAADLGGDAAARHEVPQLQPQRNLPGTFQRDIGPVAFVPRVGNAPADQGSGCSVSPGGFSTPWLAMALAFLLFGVRRRGAVLLAVAAALCFARPALTKVISDSATLRIDLGQELMLLPQPNGPAAARAIPQGQPSGSPASIEAEDLGNNRGRAALEITRVAAEVQAKAQGAVQSSTRNASMWRKSSRFRDSSVA